MFQKNRVVTGKIPLFVIDNSFEVAILFVLTLASNRAVLNENDVFSVLVVSTKNRISRFLKKVFVFQKICFKVKVLKTFSMFPDLHIKTCWSVSQTEGYFENP